MSLDEQITHFGFRMAHEVITAEHAEQWRRRAEEFERAKPSLGEHLGDGDEVRLRAAWRRCHETAKACRAKADFTEWCRRDDIQNELRWESVADQLAVDLLLLQQRRAGRPALRLIPGGEAA